MVRTIAQLRACSDEELIREHDQKATNTEVGTGYYLSELSRRDNERAIKAAHKLARWTLLLAGTNTIVSIVALVIALAQ